MKIHIVQHKQSMCMSNTKRQKEQDALYNHLPFHNLHCLTTRRSPLSYSTNTLKTIPSIHSSLNSSHSPNSSLFHHNSSRKMSEEQMLPRWLSSLLSEKFYDGCVVHQNVKKNEKNIFCVDCCVGFCAHCVNPHVTHRLLQIRRYVYHDVLRVNDAEKLMDCSNIQSNFTNGAYVVFLNQRPQTRCKTLRNCCIWCRRGVQGSNSYCSIFCKIQKILSEGPISKCVYDCEELNVPEEDGLMTPDSILDQFAPIRTSSSSSASYGFIDCRTLACTAASEIVRKKRTSNPRPKIREVTACVSVTLPPPELAGNRRKIVPRRSPFY